MKVQIWTDGSCYPNPGGPGGWAFVLRFGDREWESAGHLAATTNIQAELNAAIHALAAIPRLTLGHKITTVELTTDLQYVYKAMTVGLKKVKVNHSLLHKLLVLTKLYHPTVYWVRGHNGHPENSRCDRLAEQARLLAHPDRCVETTDGAHYDQQQAAQAPVSPGA